MIIRWTLLVAPLVLLLGCSSPTQRSEEVHDSEGIEMPDERPRPGESSEERRERLGREWAEYYGSTKTQSSEQPAEPLSELVRFLVQFKYMVVYLPLIIGLYVLTRMTDFLFPGRDDTRRPRMFTRGVAIVTFVITAFALVDLVVIILRR